MTPLQLALATSHLCIRQGLMHAGSSVLRFIPISMLTMKGDMLHMTAQSDYVLVWMTKVTKSGCMLWQQLVGVVKNFIASSECSFQEKYIKRPQKRAWTRVTASDQIFPTFLCCVSISLYIFVT